MSDQVNETKMSYSEQMDSARTVLAAAALKNMIQGFLPDSGRGTINSQNDGTQHIVGLNNGLSRIDWSEKTTRTVNGNPPDLEIVDTTVFPTGSTLTHKQKTDAADPSKTKDEIVVTGTGGSTLMELKGSCSKDASNGSTCNFDVTLPTGGGKAEIVNKKNVIVEELNQSTQSSKISVDFGGTRSSAEIKYETSGPTATYEYQKIEPEK